MSLDDFKCGLSLLLENESMLSDMFANSMDQTHGQVYDELENWLRKRGGKCQASELYKWLRDNQPAHQIDRVVKVAQSSGLIKLIGEEGIAQQVELRKK